jgi:hypothetical protein
MFVPEDMLHRLMHWLRPSEMGTVWIRGQDSSGWPQDDRDPHPARVQAGQVGRCPVGAESRHPPLG